MQIYRKNCGVWSVVSAIVAVIWASYAFSGVWGIFCPPGSAAAPSDIASLLHSAEDHHAQVCHCLSCPGGKRCCCLASEATTPASQALMTARCSDEIPVQTATVVMVKIVFPAAVLCPAVFFKRSPEWFPLCPAAHFASLSGLPLLPPPRLS